MRTITALFTFFLCLSAHGQPATIHIPGDYLTIQEGIDAAKNGDTVLVSPGTYGRIDFKGKAIDVIGEEGPEQTVMRGNHTGGSVVRFASGELEDSILKGFGITNGYADEGAGVYCMSASPTVIDCIIYKNHADRAAGFYTKFGDPVLTRCTITENKNTKDIFPGGGTGFCNEYGNPVLTDCRITKNLDPLGLIYVGGAGVLSKDGFLVLNRCVIADNVSEGGDGGGGLLIQGGTLIMNDCMITGNSIGSFNGGGGGLFCEGAHLSVKNCTFTENDAGWGGAICILNSNVQVVNCILWNNLPDEVWTGSGCPCLISYSCVSGGYPGDENIPLDPLFAGASWDDYHLTYQSPCRNSGDNSVVLGSFDIEGDPRIAHGTVDMGADEFHPHLYVTGDKTPGGAIAGKFVGLPGTNPVGLLVGHGILPSPLNTAWGELWLQAPLIVIPVPPIPGNGVLFLPVVLPPSVAAPYDVPMQALIGLNKDSLTNPCVLEVR